MPESPSETFKKRLAKRDSRRKSFYSNPWESGAREKDRRYAVQPSSPYKGFHEVKPVIMSRDKYTCKICQKNGEESLIRPCLLERKAFLKKLLANPEEHQAHVIEQAERGLKRVERFLCAPSTSGLMVHHLDGDKTNQQLSNLVTLCTSCHASITRRRLSEEKVRSMLINDD